MIRRVISVFLAAVLLIAMTACGSQTDDGEGTELFDPEAQITPNGDAQIELPSISISDMKQMVGLSAEELLDKYSSLGFESAGEGSYSVNAELFGYTGYLFAMSIFEDDIDMVTFLIDDSADDVTATAEVFLSVHESLTGECGEADVSTLDADSLTAEDVSEVYLSGGEALEAWYLDDCYIDHYLLNAEALTHSVSVASLSYMENVMLYISDYYGEE